MDEKQKVTLNMENFKKKIQEAVATITTKEAKQMLDELSQALTPYIVILENEDLIKEELEKRGFTGDVYKIADSDNPTEQQMFMDAFHTVAEALEKKSEKDDSSISKECEQAIKVIAKKPNGLNFPIDKINRSVWLFATDEKGHIPGEITITNFTNDELLPFSVEGEADKKRGKERTIYYGIDPDPNRETTMHVSRKLTAFDRRVHDAIGTLYNVGNEYMSMSQIAIAMGNTGRPNSRMLERIESSIDKMMTVRIILDQSEDYDAYNKIQQRYKGPLIVAEQKEAMINGQLVADALHVFREPLLMEFARNRKQITTIPREVIETKKRQTENNLAIEGYLLERISRMKGNKRKTIKKISYKSILKMLNLSGKQQQRAIPVIWDYLEHYKSVCWIKDYKKIDDGIEICL